MLFKNVSIHTIAHLEAPIVVTSAEMSERLAKTLKRLRLPLNYLERMSGIKERRFWDGNQTPSAVATLVADKVIEKSGLQKNDISAIISTSVTKDFIEPSIASIVHSNLKMQGNCINFDLGNACLGFLNGMQVASAMIESGQMNHVLVVAGENANDLVEPTLQRLEQNNTRSENVRDQLATLTLGSGAVAMIISRSNLAPHGHPIRGLVTLAATEHTQLCRASSGGIMVTDAPKILEAGMDLTLKIHQLAIAELNWNTAQFDEFAIHQIGKVHTKMFRKMLGIESRKLMETYPKYGNMGPASLPFVISKLETTGRLVTSKRLAIVGIGSGLNSMMMDIQW